MRWILALMLLCLVPEARAADALQVDVEQLGEGEYRLVVTFPQPIAVLDAQQAILPVAMEMCGSRTAQLGRYKFRSTAPLTGSVSDSATTQTSMLFEQQVRCGDSLATTAADSMMAPSTSPTEEDEAKVRRLTLAYLAAKDAGEFDTAHAMFSASAAEFFTVTSWRLPRAAFNRAAGGGAQPAVNRMTWYDDPANAPAPGRYVAADYSATYDSAAFYCGYVMWLLQPDGSYRIVRQEEGLMGDEEARKVKPGDMAAVRAQLQCRD